jgi:amino acid transporter
MKSPASKTDGAQVLRANALSFPSVLMQSITHIAPAVGLVFVLQFITTMAGIAAPLAFALAFLIVLAIAICLVQLALHLPSAGGYYTYVSRALNPKAGFLAAWMFFLYEPPTAAVNLAFLSFMLHNIFKIEAGIRCPWYVFFLAAVCLITVLIYRGIEISATFVMWLTGIEILIVVCLAITGFMHPGDGRLHLQDFASWHSFGQKGFYLAVVFSILIFTGFESVAPLAEETRDPKRTLPRAVLISTSLTGLLFVACSMAILTGWGNSHVASFASSTEAPVIVLAKKLWGSAWVVVLIAVTNSILEQRRDPCLFRHGQSTVASGCFGLRAPAIPNAAERYPFSDLPHAGDRSGDWLLDWPRSGVLRDGRGHDPGAYVHLLRGQRWRLFLLPA